MWASPDTNIEVKSKYEAETNTNGTGALRYILMPASFQTSRLLLRKCTCYQEGDQVLDELAGKHVQSNIILFR